MKKLLAVSLLALLSLPVFASDWKDWESFSIPKSSEQHWICGMATVNRTDRQRMYLSSWLNRYRLSSLIYTKVPGLFRKVRLLPCGWILTTGNLSLMAYGDGQIVSIAIPSN